MAKPVNPEPANKGSNTAIIVAIIGLVGTISVAIINNYSKSNNEPKPATKEVVVPATASPAPGRQATIGNLQQLQFGGMYISKAKPGVADSRTCLRFFTDGLVVGAVVSLPEIDAATRHKVLTWLNKDFRYNGRYVLDGNKLSFDIKMEGVNPKYSGTIDDFGALQLREWAPNGKVVDEEYSFIPE